MLDLGQINGVIGLDSSPFDKVLDTNDLVGSEKTLFIATGITDGDLVDGVRYMPGGDARTHSVVMRSESGTVRWVEAHHRLDKVSAWRAAHGG